MGVGFTFFYFFQFPGVVIRKTPLESPHPPTLRQTPPVKIPACNNFIGKHPPINK